MTTRLRFRNIETQQEFPLADGLVIGREASCDITLDSSEVSRRHARVVGGAQGLELEDLNSTNGVKIDGRMSVRGRLQPGQLVVLGDISLMVVDDTITGDSTLVGAHLPDQTGSMVLDQSADDSTTFRGQYAMPGSWSREDYEAFESGALDVSADRALLQELLKHRGISQQQAMAALMSLQDEAGQEIYLLKSEAAPQWSVGRDPNAVVCVDKATVSTRHALISHSGGNWRVEDQGSTNGIMINGQRVDRHELSPGEVLTLGKVKLLFDLVPG